MIINQEPISMSETRKVLTEDNQELEKFIKSFIKQKPEKAEEMRKELIGLGLIKMKTETAAKIVDLSPEDASDLNKIFTDAGLDEDETTKILEVVKKYK
jgi:DNA-directed RNA polymerase subunit F